MSGIEIAEAGFRTPRITKKCHKTSSFQLRLSCQKRDVRGPILEAELRTLKGLKNVEVLSFGNLLIEFAQSKKASVIIKGLRAVSDFEYELQMGLMNRNLDEKMETLFMIPSQEFSFLSSNFVKEIARHGGDVHKLVPRSVAKKLIRNGS